MRKSSEARLRANENYRKRHNIKKITVELNADKIDRFKEKLAQKNFNMREFFETVIDSFLKEK